MQERDGSEMRLRTVSQEPGSAPRAVLVTELVATQAAERPEAVALTAGSQVLSYQELDRQANGVAAHLRSCGVGADVLVGLYLPRSIEMVVGALGILKAGGAYVPLDPAYPAERLALMLDDAEAPVGDEHQEREGQCDDEEGHERTSIAALIGKEQRHALFVQPAQQPLVPLDERAHEVAHRKHAQDDVAAHHG